MIGKFLFLIVSLSVVLNASLNTKVKGIIGYSAYNKHKNLINYIFKNKSAYYTNGKIDYVKVTSALQNNGLLKLGYGANRFIDVTFTINDNPKKSFKILNDSLKTIGHYYYFTKEANKSDNSLKWTIKLKTKAAINPLRLSQELQKNGCRVVDIQRGSSYKWSYYIDTRNSDIEKTVDLINESSQSVRKSSKPYMVRVSNANALNIQSNNGNNWHPNIIFYDDELNIIDTFKDDSLRKDLRVDVPNDTKYIKINDLYSLANLKRGLTITKE
jgi:hypothetical protein